MSRRSSLRLGFWLGLCLALIGGEVQAQSILERRYTSAKLDGLWQGTLGTAPPPASVFELLAPGPGAAEPTVPPESSDLGVPFSGVLVGESATVEPGVQRGFPVIPIPPEDAATVARRLAWAEIYLTRYAFFERTSTDDAETIAALTERQYAAALEAYLYAARLYFAAPELPEKCHRLTRMQALSAGPLAGATEASLPEGWRPFFVHHSATEDRLGDDALAHLVCSVEPVRGRAATIELVETRVRERIIREVRTKVDETLSLLEASSTAFQTLVNDMDVAILSAEILELERVLGNSSANMILVKEDQLDAATTLDTLEAVDLSSLNRPSELQEFADGAERMAAMEAEIDGVLSTIAQLSLVVGDASVTTDLAPCASLKTAYSALDLSLDSGRLTAQIMSPYEECLARARAVVARFQEPSLEKAFMAELSRRVRQLSEAHLSTASP